MMTRSLSLAAALVVAVGLAACGDSGSSSPGGGGTSGKPSGTPSGAASVSTEPAVSTMPAMTAAASTQTAAVSDATTAEAQTLLEQATTYIKENKLDLADKAVTKLEAMKSKLPPEWQGRVDQARSALETAKKASLLKGGQVPTMPGGMGLPR